MNRRTALRSAFAIALPALLSACAGFVPTVEPAPVAMPDIVERRFIETIDLSGRLSVRYRGQRNEESLHGSFTWAQTASRTKVTLLSPLGQTVAIIDVTPQGATFTQAGQPVRSATDVDGLTADTLGWPLPVSGLREWLQGIAVDATGRRFVATPHSSNVMTRDGWQIHYANWLDDSVSPQNRPRRIDLARATQQAGDVSIRIVIDSWQEH